MNDDDCVRNSWGRWLGSHPLEIRRKFRIDAGTRVGFLEDKGRVLLQPLTDAFIESMEGLLAGRGLPGKVERDKDKPLR